LIMLIGILVAIGFFLAKPDFANGFSKAIKQVNSSTHIQQSPNNNIISSSGISSCFIQNRSFSPNAVVYTASSEGTGKPVGFAIDQSGREATQLDLSINSKSKPVILMLAGQGPTIWNIRWTDRTVIEAIIVSGREKQALAGLTSQIPVVISTAHEPHECGFYLVENQNFSQIEPIAEKLFKRPVKQSIAADQNDEIVIGEPLSINDKLLTSIRITPESHRITE